MSSINKQCFDPISTALQPYLNSSQATHVREYIGLVGESDIDIVKKTTDGKTEKIGSQTIYLINEKGINCFAAISAYKLDGTLVGKTNVNWIRNLNGSFFYADADSPNTIPEPFGCIPEFWCKYLTHYGPNSSCLKLSRLFIETINSLKSDPSLKGIGTDLMYYNLLLSILLDNEGRMMLDAVRDSHGFYFHENIGMSTIEGPERDHDLREKIKRYNSGNSEGLNTLDGNLDLGAHKMYLPEASIRRIFELAFAKVRLYDSEQTRKLEAFKKTMQSTTTTKNNNS